MCLYACVYFYLYKHAYDTYLEVPVLPEEQVLRLEVAVGHRHLVQVLQGEDDAPAEEGGHVEREPAEGRLGDGRVPLVDVRPEKRRKRGREEKREKGSATSKRQESATIQ